MTRLRFADDPVRAPRVRVYRYAGGWCVAVRDGTHAYALQDRSLGALIAPTVKVAWTLFPRARWGAGIAIILVVFAWAVGR